MTTQAQMEANRSNAQQSTGPRTAEGKRRVSRNAITHGLTCHDVVLPEERGAPFEQYRNAMLADHQAVGAEEQDLVERMVAAQWRLRRLWRAETDMYSQARLRMRDPQAGVGTCMLFDAQQERGFTVLDRREATLTREYHRCSRRLQALQDLRRKGLRHVIDAEEQAAAAAQPAAAPAARSPAPTSASSDSATRQTPKQSQPGAPNPGAPPDAPAAPVASGRSATAIPETAKQSQSPVAAAPQVQEAAPERARHAA